MSILDEISKKLQQGNEKIVKKLVLEAINEGIIAKDILEEGLLAGMNVIGKKFKNNEVFVPDVFIAARAMDAGVALLKPLFTSGGIQAKVKGRVVLGTVKGDLHTVGKNLVKIMMEAKGLEVIDLGIDVSAVKFVEKAKETGAQIIALSALLTATRIEMKTVVEEAKNAGIRDKVTIMVGGAPLTYDFCKSIGADIYAPDASSAADEAAKVCMNV